MPSLSTEERLRFAFKRTNMAADNVVEGSDALKRKLDEEEDQKTKDEELTSPPAKIRATDDKKSETGQAKPSGLDVASAGSSNQTLNQTTSDNETSEEREKMQ